MRFVLCKRILVSGHAFFAQLKYFNMREVSNVAELYRSLKKSLGNLKSERIEKRDGLFFIRCATPLPREQNRFVQHSLVLSYLLQGSLLWGAFYYIRRMNTFTCKKLDDMSN